VSTTYDGQNQAIATSDTRGANFAESMYRMGGTLMWHYSLRAATQGGDPGGGGGTYTTQAGDTLTGIALRLWGDGALWYKLAEANGLASDSVAEGLELRVPTAITRLRCQFTKYTN
jgi:LysM domain